MAHYFLRKKLRLGSIDYSSKEYVFFITICCQGQTPYFYNVSLAELIAREIERRNDVNNARIYCYTVMPDHVHLLMQIGKDFDGSLQKWVSSFKSFVAREAKHYHGIDKLWQKNFHDHLVRDEDGLLEIAEYILNNPVRKGLVQDWREYRFSASTFDSGI